MRKLPGPGRFLALLSRYHRDQRGLEALQTVMILSVAAVCLIVVKYWWPSWSELFNKAMDYFIEN